MSKRVAIVLRGAVSKAAGSSAVTGVIYSPSKYVNIDITRFTIDKHIISKNPGYEFDFFIHSWSVDLQDKLLSLFKPVEYLIEDNNQYAEILTEKMQSAGSNNFRQVSQFFSLQKGCNLLKDYVQKTGTIYDYVICYRPDVTLWKDMDLSQYDPSIFYVNQHSVKMGDFHIVTGLQNLQDLIDIYNSISPINPPMDHMIIRTYLENMISRRLENDDIIAGQHQEVTRKLIECYQRGTFTEAMLNEYGISFQEIASYLSA